MNRTNCPICNSILKELFTTTVLQRHEALFLHCSECGFLCAADPYWLEESYSSAISVTDTGLMVRNIRISKRIAAILYFLFGERGTGRYFDVAGGYGVFTRLMRDYGFDFFWGDKYCQNLMARGFEYSPEVGSCYAVTAIESIEHTENPLKFIRESLALAQSDTMIFTTELFEGTPPLPSKWWYYSFETGQHISLFQRRTLDKLADRLGMHVSSNGWLHILSKVKINERLLQVLTGKMNLIAFEWVRRNMSSRMTSDHDNFVNKLNNTGCPNAYRF